jgi:polysaccharide deacetylase family protein (PEP-CTERM system associated)
MTLTFTLDLEDHQPLGRPARYEAPTERVLAWLADNGARATVFVVGELARRSPGIVARIAEAGHEIGVHGLRHVPLSELDPDTAVAELREAREAVEQAAGVAAPGFRAPIFSLTRATPWAPAALREAGYTWSSSVLPASNPLHGLAGMPMAPFRWAGGPVELPCPVGGVGRVRLPFMGGAYVRYLPLAFSRRARRGLPAGVAAWSYLHPYDLDPDEPFFVLPHASWLVSRILHARRGATLERVERLTRDAGGFGPPLGEVAARAAEDDALRVMVL